MRRVIPLLIFLFTALAVQADVPALLGEALQKTLRDTDRWAYTQTSVEQDGKGKVLRRSVVRFDPSKPYAEQYTPLLIDGREPSSADFKKYRRRGEKRGERIDKVEREGSDSTEGNRQSLGELMDLEHATVASEDEKNIIFEVPLKKEGNKRLPPDKFQVLARVDKATHAFQRIEATLREPMRAALVVKIKSGEGLIEFSSVDPKFAPTPVVLRGTGLYSILFIPGGRSYEATHSDFKRVKPYGDRFDVQIGTMKTIDF